MEATVTNERNPQYMHGKRLLTNILLDPDQIKALDQIADRKRTSRAQLVREAVDLFLVHEEQRVA